MSHKVTIVLVGIGGHGEYYLSALLDQSEGKNIELVGAVEVQPSICERLDDLQANQVPLFTSLGAFFEQRSADLAIISSPIHFHCSQTCLALSRQTNVLCEKPAAATIQEVRQMGDAEKSSGKRVAIGYQWSFSTAIGQLKQDIQRGVLGKPIRFKTLVCWPRSEAYYTRNDWAGKLRSSDGGWILDSPINNATGHYLHNMFYVLGPHSQTSELPVEVTAELYRANRIESFDVGVVRCYTASKVEILFYSAHAVSRKIGPIIDYEFEEAHVRSEGSESVEGRLVAHFRNGNIKSYGSPDAEPYRKLWDTVESVRRQGPIACGVDAATAHQLCVSGMHDSASEIQDFPMALVEVKGQTGQRQISVRDLEEILMHCYDRAVLPAESDTWDWATPGRTIDLRQYHAYPGGARRV